MNAAYAFKNPPTHSLERAHTRVDTVHCRETMRGLVRVYGAVWHVVRWCRTMGGAGAGVVSSVVGRGSTAHGAREREQERL